MPSRGFALCAAAVFACAVASAQLTEPEQRGRRIYLEGTSAAGRAITATLADGSSTPASVLVCGACHGDDGQGRPESGVVPPDITWANLTKPYGRVDAAGRTRPAYTEASLERAIRVGADSAGNALGATMPRYQMAAADMADLLAYLRVLGQEAQPGVTAGAIRIGAVLGSEGPGEAVGKMLAAYFDTVNSAGGVYGRRLELVLIRPTAAEAELGGVFALVSSVAPGRERDLAAAAEKAGVPIAGLITLSPEAISGRSVFMVLPGIREQARALLAFAAEDSHQNVQGAVVYDPQGSHPDIATAEYARGGAAALQKRGITHVVMLAPAAEQREFAKQAAALGWRPTLLVPASIADRELLANPGAFERVVLAFPTMPAEERIIQGPNPAFQMAASCGARMLVEGLMRAGRQVTRARLVAALEGLRNFDAGVGPPLSFGPNRRIAASGAHLVSLSPNGEWTVVRNWWPVE